MSVTLFLCGDVMLGRGIDQVLPYPGDPQLHEPYVHDAREYIAMAVEKNGPMPTPVDFSYVWGDALAELEQAAPDFRIINLETSVTAGNSYAPQKDIHYRMNPKNISCLKAAKIDCAVLANNHILDFGYQGLAETLATLNSAGIQTAGAGANIAEAAEPAIMGANSRVLLYACGHGSSGVGLSWAAEADKPGVSFLPDFSDTSLVNIKRSIDARKRPGDIVILAIHWGGNWGYEVEQSHRDFAHKLIDQAGIDVVFGHSSHHPRGIELYHSRLILYGCGDFINDYEGISGYETFRDDLTLMYFLSLDTTNGSLIALRMVPMQIKRFRLQRASQPDIQWLCQILQRESEKLNTRIELLNDLQLLR